MKKPLSKLFGNERKNKTIAFAAAAAIVLTGAGLPAGAQYAAASADAAPATASEPLDPSFVAGGQLEQVSELDLDTALSLATGNSTNLLLLQLKYEALDAKQKDLSSQAEDMETTDTDPYFLPGSPGEIMSKYGITGDNPSDLLWLGPVTENNKVTNQLMAGMVTMADGMNELIASQRNQAEVAAKQMENDKWNTELDQAEAKEGIALKMTAQYAQLLAQRQQIALAEEYSAVLASDLSRALKLQAAGLASGDDIDDLKEASAAQDEQLQTLRNNYLLGLAQLSFDLGIAYNPDLALKDIEFEVPAAAKRTDTETLLAASFEMKRLYNDIAQAEWEQKHTSTQNSAGRKYLAVNVEIARQQAEQAKADLSKQIDAVYTSADNAYLNYASKVRSGKEGLAEYEKMKLRYNGGFISKHDLTKYELQLKQNDTETAVAKLQAFVQTKQVEAMERGFIQLN
ncbi:TolC family protein [Paenibacillus thailandensis]|uniref:TolC family protein n=1 Tax=Paenibacillus thailandensis TaxID=393250 RepID=A0ABW5QTK1_9BACL